jgi:hypothetical protein
MNRMGSLTPASSFAPSPRGVEAMTAVTDRQTHTAKGAKQAYVREDRGSGPTGVIGSIRR